MQVWTYLRSDKNMNINKRTLCYKNTYLGALKFRRFDPNLTPFGRKPQSDWEILQHRILAKWMHIKPRKSWKRLELRESHLCLVFQIAHESFFLPYTFIFYFYLNFYTSNFKISHSLPYNACLTLTFCSNSSQSFLFRACFTPYHAKTVLYL